MTSFLEWTRQFATEEACLEELARRKWPAGFICPRCQHVRAHVLGCRRLRQCAACRHQSSPTAGTVFEHTKLPLAKWFAAIHLAAADKGGVSALRLSKMVGVSWPTAQSMLRKLRRAMGDRDRACWLTALARNHDHEPRPTPPEKADEWLPLVHLVISNFKRFLIGTFHGVSGRRLQECLDEFVFRFNRRFWEDQLPARLVEAAVTHVPVPFRGTGKPG